MNGASFKMRGTRHSLSLVYTLLIIITALLSFPIPCKRFSPRLIHLRPGPRQICLFGCKENDKSIHIHLEKRNANRKFLRVVSFASKCIFYSDAFDQRAKIPIKFTSVFFRDTTLPYWFLAYASAPWASST